MNIHLLSQDYDVRRLKRCDVDIIYELSCQNDIFYRYLPFVTRESIIEDMEALPPQKNYKDKYYIGFFDKNTLIAHMDLVLAYPTKETAFIGLFMMNVQYQNKGIGSKIIKDVCSYLKSLGYQKVRLGVVKGNLQSYAFWIKNKFCVIDENKYIVMERILSFGNRRVEDK